MVAPVPRDERAEEVFASPSQLDGSVPSGLTDLLGAVLANRPAWHRDALCQERPDVEFFPGRGEDVRPARQVCAACLVKAECRAWALEQGAELDGIWAGTSAVQRRQMRAKIPVAERTRRQPRQQITSQRVLDRRRRPTRIMERVSAYLAAAPAEQHRIGAIRAAVSGDPHAIDRALLALVEEGYVAVAVGGIDSRGRRYPTRRTYQHAGLFIDRGSVTVVATDPPGRITAA